MASQDKKTFEIADAFSRYLDNVFPYPRLAPGEISEQGREYDLLSVR